MGSCSRCEALMNEEHVPDAGCHSYNPGDVVSIQESVHVPIYEHVLSSRNRNPSSRRGSNISTGSRVWVDNGRGGRPAVVLERRPIESQDGKEETVVLLLATYTGDYRLRSLLPLVLQTFCVAVYPHSTIEEDEAGVFHLHTSPEWTHSRKDAKDLHGWLIARQFTSSRPVTGRWKNANRADWNSHSSFKIDRATHIKLLEIIEQKWDEWTADIHQDPQRLYRYREDYNNFRDRVMRYETASSPSRTRNTTPAARSPPTSPAPQSPPAASPRAWSPATSKPASSFAQAAGRAFQKDLSNVPKPAGSPASNGSTRAAASRLSGSESPPYPLPSATTITRMTPNSSTRPRASASQGARSGSRAAALPVANDNAVPSTRSPNPSSTSAAAHLPLAQIRTAAVPSQPPSYAQVLRDKAAGRGAGTGGQQSPRS